MKKLAVVLLLWGTCYAQGDLESCCTSGENLAQRTGACAASPATDRRCAAAQRMCCVRALRSASCEQGKRAAKQGRPCEGTLETFKDCCDACSMGLQSESCSPPFSLGSPWDEAFRDCCPPTKQPTGRADRCQTDNPCSHGCEDLGGIEVRCSCDPGYKLAVDRRTCIDIDECVEGGHSCSQLNETCVNTKGGFECQHKIGCPPGYNFNPLRATCDDVDECRDDVCPRGHQCLNSVGSFSCTPCPRGFELQQETGRCIDVDECERGTHSCGGLVCQNSHGAYQCVPPARSRNCPAGFKWQGDACADVDECLEGLTNCREPEERCRNTVGGYECDPSCPLGRTFDPTRGTCTPTQQLKGPDCSGEDCAASCLPGGLCPPSAGRCPPGFKPDDQSICIDVDECAEYPEACDREEVCRNEEGSYECSPCPPGLRSDGRRCNDIDECAEGLDNCDRRSHQCINNEGGFQCAALFQQRTSNPCPPGYRAQDGACRDIDECAEGRHQCQAGREQCVNVAGAYRCQDVSSTPLSCPPGTRLQRGSNVCEDVDECAEGTATCDPSTQECANTVGSFRCVARIVCPHGYTWSEPKRKCEDVDECAEGECDRRTQRCVNTPGSFQCQTARGTCGAGFAYVPETDTCADINECDLLRPCGADQSCQNTEGSYRCVCHQGYTLDPVSKRCTDVNECQLRLHECSVSQRCDNTLGSYTCVRIAGCGTGYTLNAHTSECEDDDECVLGTHNCGPGFGCRNTVGSFRCARLSCPPGNRLLPDGTCQPVRCPTGMQTDASGQCTDVNECALPESVCRPNQRCVNTQGSFRCHNLLVCSAGFELDERGEQCVDVDECERQLSECHPDQTCKNRPGGYVCSCAKGYTVGPTRHCEDVDECSQFGSQVCASNSECINTQGSYTCNCKDGFRSNDKSCLDVDECSESPNICQQTCNNVWGSYQCSCKLGYTLSPDQRSCQDIDECAVYGGIGKLCIGFCVNEPGSFKCSCPPGYTLASDGRTCQDIDECAQEGVCNDAKAVCLNTRGGYKCNVIECPPHYVRDKNHRNRCKASSRLSDCVPGATDCLRDALSLSYNYITFVSRLQLPLSGQLDLFTMRGPRFKGSSVVFELELRPARPLRAAVPAATRDSFRLRRTSYNEAMVSLAESLQGPQDVELDLVMKIYHKGLFGGKAVAKIAIFVTEHEF